MELVTLVFVFCVALSFLLARPCASVQVNVQKSLENSNYAVLHAKIMVPSLPRKLKLNEEATVKNFADKDLMAHKLMDVSSGNMLHEKEKEENVMNSATEKGEKGTWREWVNEGPNKSEYFTMDYGWVRRRRPIHNKQIPFVP